jgi:hypothetical protein
MTGRSSCRSVRATKGVRDESKWKEGGRSTRRQLSPGAGEATALSRDSDELQRSGGG